MMNQVTDRRIFSINPDIDALIARKEAAIRASIAPRVTVRGKIRGNISGFSITSKAGGIFGTKIFVRHLSTALAIKAIVKAQPPTHFEDINRLIMAERA